VPPDGVWTTCRHMQSLGELQQLNNWSVHAEIRGILAQRHTVAGLKCEVREVAAVSYGQPWPFSDRPVLIEVYRVGIIENCDRNGPHRERMLEQCFKQCSIKRTILPGALDPSAYADRAIARH
jgi:hypothetical protein